MQSLAQVRHYVEHTQLRKLETKIRITFAPSVYSGLLCYGNIALHPTVSVRVQWALLESTIAF